MGEWKNKNKTGQLSGAGWDREAMELCPFRSGRCEGFPLGQRVLWVFAGFLGFCVFWRSGTCCVQVNGSPVGGAVVF